MVYVAIVATNHNETIQFIHARHAFFKSDLRGNGWLGDTKETTGKDWKSASDPRVYLYDIYEKGSLNVIKLKKPRVWPLSIQAYDKDKRETQGVRQSNPGRRSRLYMRVQFVWARPTYSRSTVPVPYYTTGG